MRKVWSGCRQKIGNFLLAMWFCLALFAVVNAQVMVDKTVASVTSGSQTALITYSDLLWQLALQPNVPLDPPRKDDLNAALSRLIDQRLFSLEADRLPRAAPSDEEIKKEIDKTLSYFPSAAAFAARLNRVGFESVKDPNFEKIIAQRLSIDKYIDFRFRSFIVITPDDESEYFRDVWAPDFRRRFPGLLMPTLDEKRREINAIMTEERVAARIESFLDDAKRRAEIEIISEP
jgi:hypothetical protein